MIAKNSGKIYRFPLDHNLGYGFAEVYDFTDESMFDGRYVYVYDRIDKEIQKAYKMQEIRLCPIVLGPITLYKFPNVRGLHAWRYLFQTPDLLLLERPPYKFCQTLIFKNDNWADLPDWVRGPYDMRKPRIYVDYEQVRYLETRILNSSVGVVKQFTMKFLLDRGLSVIDYYDLSDLGNRNMFVYLVNTYYTLEKTLEFLSQLAKK
jgi:hypothetical protein